MFIKELTIATPKGIIRKIEFKMGLNLIIDSTPTTDGQKTGNNVGKTTVLKLVDFCLGAAPAIIYTDTENHRDVYDLVKNYLLSEDVIITLILAEDLDDPDSKKYVIQRNFLSRKNSIRSINGETIPDKEFEDELLKILIPHHKSDKPTFRQIISHNIRYKDESISNTLKTLSKYTTDIEYETLYLFLLGCTFNDGAKKQSLITKIKQEETYKDRLEKKQTKIAYEIALSIIEDEISILNENKSKFNLNDDFENDFEKLNTVKYQINKTSSLISKMNIRKNLIEETLEELKQSISSIDLKQLETLYSEATLNITGIQKTFTDIVAYHNNMLVEKAKFIAADLPSLVDKIKEEKKTITSLLKSEKELTEKIAKGDSFEELENIIGELNEKYRIKGKYENIISQVNEVENNIENLNAEITIIDDMLFSNDFEEALKIQIKKFNKYFSAISQELYGEKYALKYDKIIDKNNRQFYKFSAFNANLSSGKNKEKFCVSIWPIYYLQMQKISLACIFCLMIKKS